MIQAIFWDNDGVLVDTEELYFAANRQILAQRGIAFDRDDFAQMSLREGRSIFDLFPELDEAEREAFHGQTRLLQYFEFVLMGGDYARYKPHPDPYLAAAARLGLAPEDCIVVEDTERGLQSAVSAGMRCIVVPNPLAEDADLSCAHAVVSRVSEVPEIVAGLL